MDVILACFMQIIHVFLIHIFTLFRSRVQEDFIIFSLPLIRMDQHTRLTFIFQEHAQRFIGVFSQRRSRMEQFLSDLEESAVQLDRMKMGASISTVAGSSVGIAGGVLSIVGLALAPVTAGVSLVLTLTGVGLGVTSGVNSVVTGITEAVVNSQQGKNIKHYKLRRGLSQQSKLASIMQKVNIILQSTQQKCMARIGQLTKGKPLALSKFARGGFITLNALFIGVDVFFIGKENKSLAKGSKSEKSQLICSRAALWKSELEAWQNIHDSLCIGIWRKS
uniref:Si:ch73-233k15.2 n=1 Tax=Sinocyclocheilus anshuiensis TaxID=1608454 RepID=A0A671K4Q4_9TELE